MNNGFQQLPINDALPGQLRDFANSFLGMNLPGNTKPETVLAKIQSAWTNDFILIPIDSKELPHDLVSAEEVSQEPEKAAAPPPPPAGYNGPKEGMIRVLVHASEEKGGSDPIPIGVNGQVMLVPRGKECDIPLPYFEALQNAEQHFYDPLEGGGVNPVPRVVKLYPYQVIAQAA